MHKIVHDLGPHIAILGTQWGDEGKGKVVDAISGQFDIICRSNGGANAGHTIVTNNKKYIFHLLPSGMLHPKTIGVIGNGTVVSFKDLIKELEGLKAGGLDVDKRVKLSLKAHVICNYHKVIDAELEKRKGDRKIGTTCRGIGPAYTDKVSRIGIRCEDLLDKELLREKLEQNAAFHSKNLGITIDAQAEYDEIMSVRDQIKPLLTDTARYIREGMQAGKKVLFEGAQAHHLDIDHGTYPFVTSSNISVGGICTGLGVPPKSISSIIGIAKAYTTRVGEGPFPSELNDDMGAYLQKQGHEFGATTGRPRRCGWFDAVVVKEAIEINGIDTINLTKLDVLTGIPEIQVAIAYQIKEKDIYSIPTTRNGNKDLLVSYQSFEGWTESLSGITDFEKLPKAAQNYILGLEQILGCSIRIIGTGPDRNDLIFR